MPSFLIYQRRAFLWLASGILFGLALPEALAANTDSDTVTFEIDGVASGVFEKAVIVPKPPSGERARDQLCLSLEGGSRRNSEGLIRWLKSNAAGAALATRPDGTLTVTLAGRGKQTKVYKLTHVIVDDFTEKTDADLSHPRLDAMKVKCDTLQIPE